MIRSSIILSIALLLASRSSGAEEHVFFTQEVLPILKAQCYKCHGEEEKLKGGLRLTSREGLLHGGDLGAAFDEANPAASLFLAMISYKDDEHQMPPKAKLSDKDAATLKRWIEMGAPYDPAQELKGALASKTPTHITEKDFEYWAYKPVQPTPVPPGAANPVDAFLNAELKAKGLNANPRASRATLIRRAYYDLLGLPPTPEAVERFVKDARPEAEAWNALIEELLARPQYGEKWARHWLDLVRYAETNGFERDNPKPEIWRYRDYVIHAFNQDKPYNQFVIEQLAGDEIEKPTMESIAATGYFRLMQWDDEPADRLQHNYDVIADNVAITSETFLGFTIGCARCHDHKADPITQKDYYSFMAFFHGVTPYATPGTMVAWADPAEKAALELARDQRVKKMQVELAALENEMESHLREIKELGTQEEGQAITFVDDARGKGATWSYTEKDPGEGWQDVGFLLREWNVSKSGFGSRGTPGARVNTEWKSKDIWMRAEFGLTRLPSSLALEIHHDEDVEVYLNGVEIYRAKGHLVDYEAVLLEAKALNALQTGKNILAVHCKQTGGGQYIDVSLRTAPLRADSLEGALRNFEGPLTEKLKTHFKRDVVRQWKEMKERIAQATREPVGTALNAVKENGTTPRPLNVHIRGSAHALGDLVEPAFPGVLHRRFDSQPAVIPASYTAHGTSGRRRALAEWIASPANPLTSRVIVNRIWQHHFGRGLVASTSDFGKLGEAPDHLALLDWLAADFVKEGWSFKKMHRLLMNSEAYQRSSAPSEAALAQDPTNKLNWRFDMRRLTAEEIRDSILAVSGNLSLKMEGPPIYPPLPSEVLATSSQPKRAWGQSSEEDSNRRSIYVHVKRSLRMPLLADYDQADTDSTCAVRFATTVPTQALGMLNSEFTNLQAVTLAKRLRAEGKTPEEQVRLGLRLSTQREPDAAQVTESLSLIDRLQKDAGLSAEAALDRFALMALNLNEFIYLD